MKKVTIGIITSVAVISTASIVSGVMIYKNSSKSNNVTTTYNINSFFFDNLHKNIKNKYTTTQTNQKVLKKGPTTPQKLGIKSIDPKILNGAKIVYEVKSFDAEKGLVTVEITVTKDSSTQKFVFDVIGFKIEESISNILNEIPNGLQTIKTTLSPLMIHLGKATKADLGISLNPPSGVTYTYEVINNINDMFLNVKVTATKGSATATKDIRVVGFLPIINKDNKIVDIGINTLSDTATTLHEISSSSFITGPTTQKVLGISIPEQLGVTYKYEITGITNGEIYVEVTLASGSVTKTKIIKVTGFKPQQQSGEAFKTVKQFLVDDAINALSDMITSKSMALASTISKGIVTTSDLGISLNEELTLSMPFGDTFTFEVTDNTGDGFLMVKVTVVNDDAIATKDIWVTGFRTKT